MSKGMPRRAFLRGLLAALFAPWLARRAAASKPAPPPKGPCSDRPEVASPLTTCVYDWGPHCLTLADRSKDLVTTYLYDRNGRLVAVQGESPRAYPGQ